MKGKLVWKQGVFQEIRTSPAMVAALMGHATGIAVTAGSGRDVAPDSVQITTGRVRARAAILTTTTAAKTDEGKNHTLLRAAATAGG